MDRADIAREALEDVKVKLGSLLGRTPIDRQPSEVVDAYSVILRATRRMDASSECAVTVQHGRAA